MLRIGDITAFQWFIGISIGVITAIPISFLLVELLRGNSRDYKEEESQEAIAGDTIIIITDDK